MIFDNVLAKFGYIKIETIDGLKRDLMGATKREYIVQKQNDMLQNKVEKLENENENLKDQAWELKERLCDETQKRFEMREILFGCEMWREEYEHLYRDYRALLEEKEAMNMAAEQRAEQESGEKMVAD